jgi:hypothetical protein
MRRIDYNVHRRKEIATLFKQVRVKNKIGWFPGIQLYTCGISW